MRENIREAMHTECGDGNKAELEGRDWKKEHIWDITEN